jgi:hypothetical protein
MAALRPSGQPTRLPRSNIFVNNLLLKPQNTLNIFNFNNTYPPNPHAALVSYQDTIELLQNSEGISKSEIQAHAALAALHGREGKTSLLRRY